VKPREVALLYRVSVHTVLAWIRSGELRAVNVARGPRPRWIITEAALAAFEAARSAPTPPLRRRNSNRRRFIAEDGSRIATS
jgi:predicted site-specific integrase-resolvase